MDFTFFGSSLPSASASVIDTAILAFTIFALFTLFSSVVWHTMAGCAHHRAKTLCAKIDYVGIAWYVYNLFLPSISFSSLLHDRLISGSLGTIVYSGFPFNSHSPDII